MSEKKRPAYQSKDDISKILSRDNGKAKRAKIDFPEKKENYVIDGSDYFKAHPELAPGANWNGNMFTEPDKTLDLNRYLDFARYGGCFNDESMQFLEENGMDAYMTAITDTSSKWKGNLSAEDAAKVKSYLEADDFAQLKSVYDKTRISVDDPSHINPDQITRMYREIGGRMGLDISYSNDKGEVMFDHGKFQNGSVYDKSAGWMMEPGSNASQQYNSLMTDTDRQMIQNRIDNFHEHASTSTPGKSIGSIFKEAQVAAPEHVDKVSPEKIASTVKEIASSIQSAVPGVSKGMER